MKFLLLFAFLFFVSCHVPTPYQPYDSHGGYRDYQLALNSFLVRFHGNSYTSEERANDFCLLRAAELANENGFACFMIWDEDDYVYEKSYHVPETSRSHTDYYGNSKDTTTIKDGGYTVTRTLPNKKLVIRCFSEPFDAPVHFYNSEIIIKSIRKAYAAEFEHKSTEK